MQRLGIFCLCISLVWGSALEKGAHNKIFLKDIGSRIINGQQATLGQIPWQAAVTVSGDEGSWFCGGSIISEEWILTAGHCVAGANLAEVQTGIVTLNGGAGTVTAASQFILHQSYNADTLANDIGLIRLNTPLVLDENTAAIPLSSDQLGTNVEVQVSGWGVTSDGGTSASPNLNYVYLLTISDSECAQDFETLPNGVVCATSADDQARGICNGDSGGPLVMNANTSPIHVAIASFTGTDGCESESPSGFTRTAFHREWIRQNTDI